MRSFALRIALLILSSGALLLASVFSVSARASLRSVTPDEFWGQVNQTLATLNGLKSQSTDRVEKDLTLLADQWAEIDAITLPEGRTAPLDTGFLVAQLRQRPYDLGSLTSLFAALRTAHQSEQTPGSNSSQGELSTLQSILKRPEFQWNQQPSPFDQWWNDLMAKINNWLHSIFGDNQISIPIPFGDLIAIVSVVLLALVLLYIFRSLFGDLIFETALDDEHMAGDELLTAESALQKAKQISKGGDYRTAVRYLYLSSLLTLDERGLLRFDRSKTNREYLRSVAGFPQLSAPLRDVIDVFDRVWYGFQALDENDFEHYVQKVDELREQKK